jgi:hypothetical protein
MSSGARSCPGGYRVNTATAISTTSSVTAAAATTACAAATATNSCHTPAPASIIPFSAGVWDPQWLQSAPPNTTTNNSTPPATTTTTTTTTTTSSTIHTDSCYS